MTAVNEGTVIVTGGGYGIGRAASLALAGDGRKIAVVDIDAARAEEVALAITANGGAAIAITGDVSDPTHAEAAVAEAGGRLGLVTGLVTCAAVRIGGTILDVTHEQWQRSLRIGLDGVFNFCRAVIPGMKQAGGGSIVNLSSPSAYGRRGLVAYSATKAAVNVLSQCLAADHFDDRIRVNVVVPGFVMTGMTENYPAEKIARAVAHSVSGRAGTPEEVAEIVRFLMSPAGESFTGGVFGGLPLPSF